MSASLTAPNGSSQRRLLRSVRGHKSERIYQDGDAALEAHGTGTALGDPIEIGAIAGALCLRETGETTIDLRAV